jgi:Hypothetical glycosyl hydrolase 6
LARLAETADQTDSGGVCRDFGRAQLEQYSNRLLHDVKWVAYMLESDDQWWRAPFRMFQTNLRLIDADIHVDAVADTIAAHGADAWLVNTGGIYASYPSELGSQTANPHLHLRASGDLVADAITAAHARKLRYIARMDFSKVLDEQASAHPDWLFLSADGHRQSFNGLITTCPSGAYFQAESFAILDDVLDRYPVDGFFFNWFTFSERDYANRYIGPCHCPPCTEGFRASTGYRVPSGPGDATYAAWKTWSGQVLLDLSQRLRDHIHGRRPEAVLILSDTSDLRYEEANNALHRAPWRHQTGEDVSAALSRLPEVPVLVNCVSFIDFPYRMGAEDPERFAQYLIQALARGASISTYIMGPPGRIQYPSLGIAGEIMRYHRDAAEWYAGLRQNSPVLLVGPGRHTGGDAVPDNVQEFRGVFAALQELHLPFDVVDARHLSAVEPARLGSYALLILANLSPLSADAAALIDEYVRRGGRLLATGSSGFEGDVCQLACSGILQIANGRSGADLLSSYIQTDAGTVVPLHGDYHVPVIDELATTAMRVLRPAPYGPPEYCYGHRQSSDPGVVLMAFGAGRSAHVPWSIGRAYADIGTRNLRDVLAAVIGELVPAGFGIATDLPEAVELVVGRGHRGDLIHLISHVHATSRSYADPVPLSGYRLKIAGGGNRRARSLVTGRDLTTVSEGGWLVIELPTLNRFDAIALEPHS